MGLGGEDCLGFQDGSQALLAGVVVEDRGVCHDALESDFVATDSTSIQLQRGVLCMVQLVGSVGQRANSRQHQQQLRLVSVFPQCSLVVP